ncbi:MAG TPA: glycosyltransferase family 4 protein [Kineosporiaceae bacterium]|nr:glycosyltransferase family 4 protein [Kineosporiaceae bacterium]
MTVGDPQPRHVLFLNRRDTTHPEGGGSEVFLERTAARLAGLGWRVTIGCERYAGSTPVERRDGFELARDGVGLGFYRRAALHLLRGEFGPVDVVVDVQNGMPFCSPLVTRAPVVNLVHHVHRELWPVVLPPTLARLGWFAESRVAPRVYRGRRYVAVSAATRDELAGLGVDRDAVTVVHNGTDVRPQPHVVRSDRPTVLAVGRLVPHKRLDIAVRAVAALVPDLPDLRLVVAGTGYAEPPLRALVRELGVERNVELLGWVDEETKHRLMAQAWVMAMPSLKEGWGLAVIEAAAHGTPSVAFRGAGGLSESIVDGETGLLVDGGEAAFTATLRLLLTGHDLRERMREAARVHATGFTWEATAKAVHAVLEDAVLDHAVREPR